MTDVTSETAPAVGRSAGMHQRSPSSAAIPIDSRIFGYGPMIPFLLGAVGCWFAPSLHALSIDLTVIWGSIILSFLGGVRRGFGFGNSGASTMVEILTMIVYVSIAGLALIFAGRWVIVSVCLLTFGYIIVPIADYRASRSGNAPDHFAALRPKQMSIAIVSLVAIVANLLVG